LGPTELQVLYSPSAGHPVAPFHGGLYTADRLAHIDPQHSRICCCCVDKVETRGHFIDDCSFHKLVWNKVAWLGRGWLEELWGLLPPTDAAWGWYRPNLRGAAFLATHAFFSPCRGLPTHRRQLPFAASLCIHSPHAVEGEGGCASPWANLPPLPHPSAPCACTGNRRPTLHMGHKARSGLPTPPPPAPAGRGAEPRVVDPHLFILYFTHCSPMYSTTTLIPSYHN